MTKLFCSMLCLPLLACGTDVQPLAPDGAAGNTDVSGDVAGHVTTATTWADHIKVTALVTVDPGITLTVAAGTTISVSAAAGISVLGTMNVQGTKAARVQIQPVTANGHYMSTQIAGQLNMSYVVQNGGGIETAGTGKATIVDSAFSRAAGDFLVMSGGTVEMSYSSIGLEAGVPDTTHCDMHFEGPGNTIHVSHTNLSGAPYGLMFYGGTSADLTFNNWFGNTKDIDTQPGVVGDVSNGWFEKAAPSPSGGATLTRNNLAAARLTDAGPR